MQEKLDSAVNEMKRFYDFERFDINYLADAVLFTKADQKESNTQFVVSQPGARQKV